METEENTETNLDFHENTDSEHVDIENVEESTEATVSEEIVPQEELSEFTNGSPSLPGTSSDSVRGKENHPPEKKRLVKLPLARVKHIMKLDPDCTIVSGETVFLVTKATELFLEYIGKESGKYTQMAKRKTVLKRDVEAAIDSIPHLCFLEGALE